MVFSCVISLHWDDFPAISNISQGLDSAKTLWMISMESPTPVEESKSVYGFSKNSNMYLKHYISLSIHGVVQYQTIAKIAKLVCSFTRVYGEYDIYNHN